MSVSSRTPATLSNRFDDNVGSPLATVFSGYLPGTIVPIGSSFTFAFQAPFMYVPTNGDLLIDVLSPGTVEPGAYAFDSVINSTSTARLWRFGSGDIGAVDVGYGLRTDFQVETVVPEPGAFALTSLGILGVAAIGRRGRRLD